MKSLAALGLASLALSTAIAQPTVTYEVLVAEGDPAPGQRPFEPWTYLSLYDATTRGSGQISFFGKGDATNPAEAEAIWSVFPASLSLIARVGDPAPGPPGTLYERFSIYYPPVSDDAGVVWFSTYDSFFRSGGIIRHNGIPATIAEVGQLAPGAGGAVFDDFSSFRVSPNGLGGIVAGTDNRESGIWIRDSIGLRNLVFTPAAANFGAIIAGVSNFGTLFDDGSVVYLGRASGGLVGASSSCAVYQADGEAPTILLYDGESAPGFPGFTVDGIRITGAMGRAWITASINNGALTRRVIYSGTSPANLTLEYDFSTLPPPAGFEFDGVDALAVSPNGRLVAELEYESIAGGPDYEGVFAQDGDGDFFPVFIKRSAVAYGPYSGILHAIDFESSAAIDAQNRIVVKATIIEGAEFRSFIIRATLTDPIPNGPPTLTVKGKKRIRTPRREYVIRGTATDDGTIARVEYKAGKRFRSARGTDDWRATVKLKKRRTRVLIRAIDNQGALSPKQKVILIRR